MPYYHVDIRWNDEIGARWGRDIDLNVGQLNELNNTIKRGEPALIKGRKINPYGITKLEIWKTDEKACEKSDSWAWITHHGENVTKDFIIALPTKPNSHQMEEAKIGAVSSEENALSKNIFIVHGRNHEPMKELKIMLTEFGLNPIVLHEKASASRTVVEKLEKYSDVGYAFVILTPDDGAVNLNELDIMMTKFEASPKFVEDKAFQFYSSLTSAVKGVARQNVILEFGYFMGLLGRDRVCCLHMGDIELPSDMHGIVYIPFKDSVEEARDMIIKELREAGYKI